MESKKIYLSKKTGGKKWKPKKWSKKTKIAELTKDDMYSWALGVSLDGEINPRPPYHRTGSELNLSLILGNLRHQKKVYFNVLMVN